MTTAYELRRAQQDEVLRISAAHPGIEGFAARQAAIKETERKLAAALAALPQQAPVSQASARQPATCQACGDAVPLIRTPRGWLCADCRRAEA